MLTAEQIREITFSSGFNGYKAGEVDAFLDSCAETVASLTESNEEMKRKMKILADKLVEYRNEESSIHAALMSAQRMGESVVREANQKATLILDDARAKAEKILEKAEADIIGKKEELANLENEVALFKNRLMAIYKEHLVLIQQLPEPEEEAAPAEETPIVEAPAEEEPAVVEAEPVEPVAEEEPVAETEPEQITLEQVQEQPLTWNEPEIAAEPVPLAEEEPEEEPSSRFADLQFGDDYPTAGNSRGFFNRKK